MYRSLIYRSIVFDKQDKPEDSNTARPLGEGRRISAFDPQVYPKAEPE